MCGPSPESPPYAVINFDRPSFFARGLPGRSVFADISGFSGASTFRVDPTPGESRSGAISILNFGSSIWAGWLGYHEIRFLPLWSGMHLTTFGFWFRPPATSRSGARARFMVNGGIARAVGGIKGIGFCHVVGTALYSGKLFWVEAV